MLGGEEIFVVCFEHSSEAVFESQRIGHTCLQREVDRLIEHLCAVQTTFAFKSMNFEINQIKYDELDQFGSLLFVHVHHIIQYLQSIILVETSDEGVLRHQLSGNSSSRRTL